MLTQRAAAKKYHIPRSTIKNKLRGKYLNKPGRPTVFTEEEEMVFVANITALSKYGFLLTDFDLKMIIRDYLASQGRTVNQFSNNVPGIDWMKGFLIRHKSLSKRLANNIKRVRAQVSEEIILKFSENIAKETEKFHRKIYTTLMKPTYATTLDEKLLFADEVQNILKT